MSNVDFSDPTTWDAPFEDEDALSVAIFCMNTYLYPDASSKQDLDALDFFVEGAINQLTQMRDRLREQT